MFLSNVEEIARDCGKPSQTLHQAVGMTVKKTRALSTWNVWQRYWAENKGNPNKCKQFVYSSFPHYHTNKNSVVDGATHTNNVREAFKDALQKASPEDFTNKMVQDSAACFAALPWLAKWNEELVTQAVADVREVGTLKARLRKEIKPVLSIVSSRFKFPSYTSVLINIDRGTKCRKNMGCTC